MSPDARDELARRQAELLLHLIGEAPAPAGFEPRRLAAAARSLRAKRERASSCEGASRPLRAWWRLLRRLRRRDA